MPSFTLPSIYLSFIYLIPSMQTSTRCRPFNSTQNDHHIVAALERDNEHLHKPDTNIYVRDFTRRLLWSLVHWPCWQNPNACPTVKSRNWRDIISKSAFEGICIFMFIDAPDAGSHILTFFSMAVLALQVDRPY